MPVGNKLELVAREIDDRDVPSANLRSASCANATFGGDCGFRSNRYPPPANDGSMSITHIPSNLEIPSTRRVSMHGLALVKKGVILFF